MLYVALLTLASAGQALDRLFGEVLQKFFLLLAPFIVPIFVMLWQLPFAFVGVWMAILGLKHKEQKADLSEAVQKLETDIRASATRRIRFSLHGTPRTYMIIGGILIAIIDIVRNGPTALNHASDAYTVLRTIDASDLSEESRSRRRIPRLKKNDLQDNPELDRIAEEVMRRVLSPTPSPSPSAPEQPDLSR